MVIHENSKMVELWTSRAENEDAQVQQQIHDLAKDFRARKYTVAVFRSGFQPLDELTSALLVHNRDKFARQEVQRRKLARATEQER